MAYMYRIGSACQAGACGRPRTHRVCDAINGTKGDYCFKHARQRLADLQSTEDKSNKSARSAQPTAEPQAPGDVMRAHLEAFGRP